MPESVPPLEDMMQRLARVWSLLQLMPTRHTLALYSIQTDPLVKGVSVLECSLHAQADAVHMTMCVGCCTLPQSQDIAS